MDMSGLLASADIEGYDRALQNRPFEFPRDHNSHPRFKTEWWYFTGNLLDDDGNAFGFQLTFFRFALTPADISAGSSWRARDAWMAHLAVTDVARGRFMRAERFSRDAVGLAGNGAEPFRVWVEDWAAISEGTDPFPLHLHASMEDASIDLRLDPTTSPIAHGENGLDRKGPEAGNASYYYSIPRLATSGQIAIDGTLHRVSGSTWLDREWSSNALSDELAGWDWLALDLSDGRAIMVYRLRTHDGRSSAYSSGSLISADGAVTGLTSEEIELEPRERWTSPATGHSYPIAWKLRLPSHDLELDVTAVIPNQEMDLSVRYWEGAVIAKAPPGQPSVVGRGYLELTGY